MLQQLTFFLHRLYVCEEDFEEEKKKVKPVFSIGLHSVSAIEMMCSCPPRTHRLALIKTTKNIIWPTVKRHIRYDSQSKYVWRFIWQAWMLNAVHDFGTRGKTKQLHVTLFKTPLRESRALKLHFRLRRIDLITVLSYTGWARIIFSFFFNIKCSA